MQVITYGIQSPNDSTSQFKLTEDFFFPLPQHTVTQQYYTTSLTSIENLMESVICYIYYIATVYKLNIVTYTIKF